MKATLLNVFGSWLDVLNSARVTAHKDARDIPPSAEWKRKILMAQHSPIRKLTADVLMEGLPYFVSVHFVRHKIGIEHWVRSQRTDRTGVDRNYLPQNAEVEHEILVNADALINISRKRLCGKASPETRSAWQKVLISLMDREPELYATCVPECIYRNGLCPEMQSCGFNKTAAGKKWLAEYVAGFENQIAK